MWKQLFRLSVNGKVGLQLQLRETVVRAILDGHINTDAPLPSSRELARQLGISRNTVVLAYQHLIDDGYLVAHERSGYYVNPEILSERLQEDETEKDNKPSPVKPFDWSQKLVSRPSRQRNIEKPSNWQQYEFPFICGQLDPNFFPLNDWRECFRQALSVRQAKHLVHDRLDADDPMLIEQIQSRLLPRRGIWASPDQILVTVGAQNALYLLATLLVSRKTKVGFEEPGYPDARNILASHSSHLTGLPVDESGLIVDDRINECDCVYVTPSHQSPTMVTMSQSRREAVLQRARKHNFLIIEDDYESEINFSGHPAPALMSMDTSGHVIYVSSLSKTLDPGLRVGYMVGPPEFIREARALRRLMLRHPPSNNAYAVALFLALGHHDSLVQRLNDVYRDRWDIMHKAVATHLPDSVPTPSSGGSSYWMRGPDWLDARALARQAEQQGILIEPGDVHFLSRQPSNYFRLGFSAIATERIEPGMRKLAAIMREARRVSG